MKSHYSLARRAAVSAAIASMLILAGCGQKGPLYMPKVPPDPFAQTAPKPAASQADTADVPSKPAAGDGNTGK